MTMEKNNYRNTMVILWSNNYYSIMAKMRRPMGQLPRTNSYHCMMNTSLGSNDPLLRTNNYHGAMNMFRWSMGQYLRTNNYHSFIEGGALWSFAN